MKKILALLLCAIMVVSVFAGCNNNSGNQGNKNGDDNVITIGIPESSSVTDYYNNDMTKWLEEVTGYTIEWELFAASTGDYSSQISTMNSANLPLPDMMIGFNLGDQVYEEYGEDGLFIDLTPYYEDKEKSQVWWDRLDGLNDPVYKNNIIRRITADDGCMYVFPSIEQSLIDTMNYQVYINDRWLENVGMSKPTNTQEFLEVLKAFRDQDANGNGRADDEIPLLGSVTTLSGDVLNYLLNMFVYVDDIRHFNVDDNGKVYLPHMTDEYREGLKFIYDLVVTEKVLNPMAITMNATALKPMTCPAAGGDALVGVVVTHPTLGFTQGDAGLLDYSCLPLWGNAIVHEDANNRRGFITKYAENPDACWEIWMAMCSEEGSIRLRYGNKGEHWDWADEGATSFMGLPAQYKLYEDVWGTQGDDNYRYVESTILPNAEQEGAQLTGKEDEVTLHKYQMFKEMRASYDKQIAEYNPDSKNLCPMLVWTNLELSECPEREDCQTYLNKALSEFATGVRNPHNDGDWNKYLQDLQTLQVDKWVTYSQGVYERVISEQADLT